MFKKMLLVGLIAAAGVIVLKGTKFFGYAKQEVASWKDWADDQVPVEKKIAQMRKDVAGLDKDLETVKTELATSIVKVREYTAQTNELATVVEAEQVALKTRGESIKDATDATERVEFRKGSFISIPEAKARLARDVNILTTKKSQLASLELAKSHHERLKETLEKQFDELRQQKVDLKTQIDAIEAEYKALQLAQMESKFQTDDSRLARIKDGLRDMQHKLAVEKEKLNLTPKVHEVPETISGADQSVEEILAPLGK